MSLPIFVINLAHSVERREAMQAQLERHHLACEWVAAVDGKALTPEQEALVDRGAARRILGRGIADTEIGGALSHLAVYQRMVDEGIEEALILEDDAEFQPGFQTIFENPGLLPRDWELVLFRSLLATPARWGRKRIFGPLQAVCFKGLVFSSAAYLLRLSAARTLLRHGFPVRMPADWLTGGHRETGVRLYGILPPVVNARGFPSTLWPPGQKAPASPARGWGRR